MKSYKLSFGTIKILKSSLAEVIVNEGVIMNEIMVDEFHDFLLTNLEPPFYLVINKKNAYSYTFEAQRTVASLKEIEAIAVILKSAGALLSVEMLLDMNKDRDWNVKTFLDRQKALDWLAVPNF